MRRGRIAGVLLVMLLVGPSAKGQTVPGDILRGRGYYLRGAGWYNLHTAEARSINVDTAIRWNQAVYAAYVQANKERSARIAKRTRLTNATIAEHQKEHEERERRLRENPTQDDILKGDALNALLIDLSDPLIHPSVWRSAEVDLPEGFKLRGVPFKFVVIGGDQRAMHLGEGTISIDRMRMGEHWPLYLRMAALEPEEKSYAKSVTTVLDECRKGELSLDAALAVQKSAQDLKMKVAEVVPVENGLRLKAITFVKELDDAARVFTTQDYAQELIQDTESHEARTVEELLAFMRKFCLEFAATENRPDEAELFENLFHLLRKQRQMLGGSPHQEVADSVSHAKSHGLSPHAKDLVGLWSYGAQGQADHEIRLHADGSATAKGHPKGRWTTSGNKVTIRWPSPKAPGGSWVDKFDLNPRGDQVHGKNQNGVAIHGARIGD